MCYSINPLNFKEYRLANQMFCHLLISAFFQCGFYNANEVIILAFHHSLITGGAVTLPALIHSLQGMARLLDNDLPIMPLRQETHLGHVHQCADCVLNRNILIRLYHWLSFLLLFGFTMLSLLPRFLTVLWGQLQIFVWWC